MLGTNVTKLQCTIGPTQRLLQVAQERNMLVIHTYEDHRLLWLLGIFHGFVFKLRKASIVNSIIFITVLILKFVDEGFIIYAVFDSEEY